MSIRGMLTNKVGLLRHPIVIEESTSGVAAGEATVAWTPFASVRAAIQGVGGVEMPLSSDVEYRFMTHYLSTVTPRMRIRWGARIFQIIAALDPTGHQNVLLIRALEIVG
jgi:head-tail adaptor